MSRKFSSARRAAFLRALAETGNQTIAAERAKVSRSWVRLHRSTDPAFERASDDAIAAAKARLGGADGRRPPSGWGSLDGEELVVKGTGGSSGGARGERTGRRVQIARARLKQWTPRVEARFLATLGATCNVKAACAEVGLTPASAYAHRKRWPRFAALWAEALETGAERIEIALAEAGGNPFSDPECLPEAELGPMTVDQAIHVLHMHKHRLHGLGKAPGRWAPPPSLDDPRMKASILRVLEAFLNRRDIPPETLAADRRAYARRRG